MAVLHLILQGNATAWGIPELDPVVQQHNEWLAAKKILLVPYSMIAPAKPQSSYDHEAVNQQFERMLPRIRRMALHAFREKDRELRYDL